MPLTVRRNNGGFMKKMEDIKKSSLLLTQSQSAHETLFLYMISDTAKPKVDKLCQILRDAKQLDMANPQTGATLLGLATALLLTNLVSSLLRYGADINHSTGLVKEEKCLPFTIALKRIEASHPRDILLPSSKIPEILRSQPEEKIRARNRAEILEIFLQHPKLDLNQRESSGKTVLEWVAELKIQTLLSFDSLGAPTQQKYFLRRLQHRARYGLNDLRDAFEPYSSTIIGYNVNKIKPYTHIMDYQILPTDNLLIMKSLEKKQYLLDSDKLDLIVDTNSQEQGLKIHQKIWELTNKKPNLYYLYQTEDQWWACGRFERSEVSIVRMNIDFDTKIISPTKKNQIIEDIRGRIYYARCLKETVAMEWHRLVNQKKQPQYMTVVGDTMATTAVVVNMISYADDIKKAYSKKTSIPYLTGLADVLCDILITNDVDPNCSNFLVTENAVIHIDGDRCWGRLREYTPTSRFSIAKSITELLEQKSLGENGCYFWNFFDKIGHGKVQNPAPIYDWLLSMVKTPQFKQELYQALLKRIFLTRGFVGSFVSYYIPHSYEPISLQTELYARLKKVRDVALKNQEFKNYLQSPEAQCYMENFLKTLESFSIRRFTYLCSHEDVNIKQIRSNLALLIPESKKITELSKAKKPVVETRLELPLALPPAIHLAAPSTVPQPESKTLDVITTSQTISFGIAEEEIIESIRKLPKPEEFLNLRDTQTGATPLGIAITLLLPKVVEELLRAGADPNLVSHLKNKEKLLPLTIAVGKIHVSSLKTLFLDPDKAPDVKSIHNGKDCNCASLRTKVILALLADPRLDIGKKDDNGKTVLKHWSKLSDTDPVLYAALVEGKLKKNPLSAYNKYYSTIPTAQYYFDIIKNKDDKPSKEFMTAITAYGFLTSIDPLTSHTMLGLAIDLLKPNYVSSLLDAKADINQPTGKKDYHLPITIAATKDHCSIFEDKSKDKVTSPYQCPRLTLMAPGIEACDCDSNQISIMDKLLASPQLKINALEKNNNSTCLDFISKTKTSRQPKLIEKGAKTFAS